MGGEERCKSLEMGIKGRGRVSKGSPRFTYYEIEEQISLRINPNGYGAGIKVKNQDLAH